MASSGAGRWQSDRQSAHAPICSASQLRTQVKDLMAHEMFASAATMVRCWISARLLSSALALELPPATTPRADSTSEAEQQDAPALYILVATPPSKQAWLLVVCDVFNITSAVHPASCLWPGLQCYAVYNLQRTHQSTTSCVCLHDFQTLARYT